MDPPSLVVISQYMSWGSLHALLHGAAGGAGGARLVVDAAAALRLAHDVAHGMAYLHSLPRDKILPTFHLNSKHIMVTLLTAGAYILYHVPQIIVDLRKIHVPDTTALCSVIGRKPIAAYKNRY